MSIVNRRNAVLGWAAWQVGKRAMRRKAQAAKPKVEGGRPNKSLAAGAAGAAATVGALAIWRKRHGGDEDS